MKNTIKTALGLLLFALFSIHATAQNSLGKADDSARIVLNSYIAPQAEGIPNSAKRLLINKLNKIATKNGMGGSAYNPRFIITPNIAVLTKDITPTAPPMIALTLEVTFYVGDGIEGTLFASESIEVKGVGRSETKAYISAIKQIKPASPAIKELINTGKNKIIEYYNSKCDFIIKEAKTLAAQKEFDAAISTLTSVPSVCKECYDKAMDAVTPIYQQQIDRECEIKLTEAKNVWGAGQDVNAANNASSYLSGIDPNSACFGQVKTFTKTMAARVKQLDQRDWNFKLKKQQDNVNLRKQAIKAVRDIGVAYGRNQPTPIYKSLF